MPQQPLGKKVHKDNVVQEQMKSYNKKNKKIAHLNAVFHSKTQEMEAISQTNMPPGGLQYLHPASRNTKCSPLYHLCPSPKPWPTASLACLAAGEPLKSTRRAAACCFWELCWWACLSLELVGAFVSWHFLHCCCKIGLLTALLCGYLSVRFHLILHDSGTETVGVC